MYANASTDNTSIEFFADSDSSPFASINLPRKKKNDAYGAKDISVNVYDKKLKGNHKIYFMVKPADTSSNCEVYINSVEFVESSIPVL